GVNTYNSGDNSWTYNAAGVVFRASCYYIASSSGSDNVGNGESTFGTRRFKFTPPPAATRVLVPENSKYFKAITQISGTANDDAKRVQLDVKRLSDNKYWDFGAASWQVAYSSVPLTPAGAAPNRTWSLSTSLPTLVSGSSYTFRAVGVSYSDVYEAGPVVNQIYFDTDLPQADVQLPAASQGYYNAMPRLGGGAQDPPGTTPPASGISKVWGEIYAVNGANAGKFWSNAAAGYTITWDQAGDQGSYYVAASSWEYVVSYPTAAFVNGVQYRVRSKSLDNTYNNSAFEGTESNFSAPNLFSYDVTVPTAVVTSVSPAQRRSGVSVASGTIQEDLVLANVGQPAGTQIQEIRLHLHYNDFDQYWNGSGWFASQASYFSAAVHQSSWSSTAMPAFTDAGTYTLWAEARDKAGNIQTLFGGNGSSVTFTVDMSAPLLGITNPSANSKISSLFSVTGTANDPNWTTNAGISGASNVQIQVSYLYAGDTYYYDNTTIFSSSALTDTNSWWPATNWNPQGPSSGTWAYAPAGLSANMVGDRVYRFRVRAQDDAFPVPNPAVLGANAVSNDNVIYDVTKPVSRVTWPQDGAELRTLASITGTAADNLAGISTLGQLEVAIAEVSPAAGVWNGVAPGTFTLTAETFQPLSGVSLGAAYVGTAWNFTAPLLRDGYKYRIKVRASDDVSPPNTETAISSVTFTFDTTPPDAQISYPIPLPDSRGNLKALTAISGTAFEQFTIKSASVSVQEDDTLFYYDTQTSSFTSPAQKWMTAVISGSGPGYTWTAPAPPLTDNKNYNLQVISGDRAGNAQVPPSPITVRYDITPPLSRPVSPADGSFLNVLTAITGTAQDVNSNPSGALGSQIRIQRQDGQYWTGSTWGSETWLAAVAGSPWA
ncbi:MAG: hypothetical protein M0011_09110, partial [Elusimicrobia bacterium]|nr:hypothetical protein [Elusimicrobiota bacterium]